MYKHFVIFLFTAVLGCKKYDENPAIVLSPKCKRLEGTWKLEYLYQGTADSTLQAMSQRCYGDIKISFYEDTNSSGPWYNSKSDDCARWGSWGLSKDKTKFFFQRNKISNDSIGFVPVGPYMAFGDLQWKITRLTNKELWMETTFNSQNWWIHYKKQ
jgi:hypothetical protein